jgi:hypothetical protein
MALPWRGMGGLMLVALTLACHHSKDTDVEPAPGEILLIVESHHQIDVVINLIHNGTSERLGTVPPGATQRFRFRSVVWDRVADFTSAPSISARPRAT